MSVQTFFFFFLHMHIWFFQHHCLTDYLLFHCITFAFCQRLICMGYICVGILFYMGFPGGACGKESTCQCRRYKRRGFNCWVGNIPWRKKWQSAPVFLHGKFHGQRNLLGCSSQGCKESDMTQCTHTRNVLQDGYKLISLAVPSLKDISAISSGFPFYLQLHVPLSSKFYNSSVLSSLPTSFFFLLVISHLVLWTQKPHHSSWKFCIYLNLFSELNLMQPSFSLIICPGCLSHIKLSMFEMVLLKNIPPPDFLK